MQPRALVVRLMIFTAAAGMSVLPSFCHVTFSRPLFGQKRECYIVEEVIEVDEPDKGNISALLGKQDK